MIFRDTLLCVKVDRSGGGVGIYIKDHLHYTLREAWGVNTHYESIFIEVDMSERNNIIVGAVYRPPSGNINLFNDEFDIMLESIGNENKWVFIAGDFNVDLTKVRDNIAIDLFRNV